MASLPQFQNDDKDFQLLQSRWGSILNPIINNPTNNSSVLKGIKLTAGNNTINHLLSRKLQGWSIVRLNAGAIIYDNQDSNPTPDKTLILVSDLACTVDIMVF